MAEKIGRMLLRLGVCQKWGGGGLGGVVGHSRRGYSTKPYSTEAALKPKPQQEEDDLHRVGLRREKIEVNGMMLNWDQAGSGDHVVLLLPGIIGRCQTEIGSINICNCPFHIKIGFS